MNSIKKELAKILYKVFEDHMAIEEVERDAGYHITFHVRIFDTRVATFSVKSHSEWKRRIY